jgi:hypothetical protein
MPTKSVAKKPTKSVAKKPTKSVAKKPTKSVAKKPTKSVAKKPTKSVAKKPTKSVAKKPTFNFGEISTNTNTSKLAPFKQYMYATIDYIGKIISTSDINDINDDTPIRYLTIYLNEMLMAVNNIYSTYINREWRIAKMIYPKPRSVKDYNEKMLINLNRITDNISFLIKHVRDNNYYLQDQYTDIFVNSTVIQQRLELIKHLVKNLV